MNAAQTAGMTRASLSVQSNLSSLAGSDGCQSQIIHGVSSQRLNAGAADAVTHQDSRRSTTSVRSRAVSVISFKEFVAEANCTTYIAIVVAMMGALMFGIDQGNFGLASEFQSFYDYWCKTHFMLDGFDCDASSHEPRPAAWTRFQSWGGSLITIGAAFGSLFVGPCLSSSFGRRLCICAGGLVCFTGCLFASFLAMKSVEVYYAGRFVTGFGAGICCFALPIYNSEIATPSSRGLTGSLFQFMVVLGGVFAAFVLAAITDWRIGMILPGLAGALVGLLIWLTPESPRYTLDKYGEEAGRRMLTKVRKNDCEPELQAMKRESEEEARQGEVGYYELFANANSRKRVFAACYLQVAQQLTGVNAFLSYLTQIFEGAGLEKDEINRVMPPGYAIYFNLLMLVGCIIGLLLIDSEYGGRRIQLLGASVIMGPPLLLAGIAKLNNWAGSISVAAICLYGPGFQVAWGIIPWVYPSEIFAMNEKEKAVGLATFFVFSLNFVINMITPGMLAWSTGWTFIFFGLLNVSNFGFVLLCIKETKGVAPEDIKALFDDRRDRAESYPQAREVSMSGTHA